MAIRPITVHGEPVLHRRAADVEVIDDEIRGHERVDLRRVAAERRHRVAQRREVDHGGDASLDAWEAAIRNRPFGIGPVTDEFLNEQQRAADLLHANGLLPRPVQVRDAVLPSVEAVVTAP